MYHKLKNTCSFANRIGVSLLAFSCVFLFTFHVAANERVHKDKYAAFVIDAHTGTVLHRENASKSLHPASLTKMMTLLMVFDALDRGKLKLSDRVVISKHAASMIPSKLDLPPGSTIKIKDAIRALVVKSANDVAVAVGEKLGGSEQRFARLMTKKAKSLGMVRTRFVNASGLHDPRQVSTARDMAKLARVLLTRYGKHYHYFSSQAFTYRGKTYKSHNKLIKTYAGMDGFKTGYIRASGFNLVSSATRHNRRIIGVVFGGKSGNLRNEQMTILMDNAFKKVGHIAIARSYAPVPERKPITEQALLSYRVPINTNITESAHAVSFASNSRWDVLNSANASSIFNRLIGQGDYDMSVRKRIETGLIAVSSHLNEEIPAYVWDNQNSTTQLSHPSASDHWSLQVGAFSTRERTEKAIRKSLAALPADLQYGQQVVAPLQTREGWIFRGRLHGYTQAQAHAACATLDECIPVAPNSQN